MLLCDVKTIQIALTLKNFDGVSYVKLSCIHKELERQFSLGYNILIASHTCYYLLLFSYACAMYISTMTISIIIFIVVSIVCICEAVLLVRRF
jgi:hypothetical protein